MGYSRVLFSGMKPSSHLWNSLSQGTLQSQRVLWKKYVFLLQLCLCHSWDREARTSTSGSETSCQSWLPAQMEVVWAVGTPPLGPALPDVLLAVDMLAGVFSKGDSKASDFQVKPSGCPTLSQTERLICCVSAEAWRKHCVCWIVFTLQMGVLILVLLILYFQILFTITFWLLLRQHLTEQKALQEKEALLSEIKIGSQENEEKGKLVWLESFVLCRITKRGHPTYIRKPLCFRPDKSRVLTWSDGKPWGRFSANAGAHEELLKTHCHLILTKLIPT